MAEAGGIRRVMVELLLAGIVSAGAVWGLHRWRGAVRGRRRLLREVQRLRLGRMLVALGVDRRRYAALVPAEVIARHQARCRGCRCTGACERWLRDPRRRLDAPRFCPNYPSLVRCAAHFALATRRRRGAPGHPS